MSATPRIRDGSVFARSTWMLDPLHPEMVRPPRTYARRLTAMGLGCGALGAGLALAVVAIAPSPTGLASHVAKAPAIVIAIPSLPLPVIVRSTAPPASRGSELSLVFRAGGETYIKLIGLDEADPISEARPRHGKLKLFDEAGTFSAIGQVSDHDVPLAHRRWKNRKLKLDTGCEATVTGFAVVGRLTGDPAYAGSQRETWDAASVMSSGNALLAAKLDGCTGLYARDVSLPEVVVLEAIDDKPLAAAARAGLIASAPAKVTQTEWVEQGLAGLWYDDSEIITQVLRHPSTGVTWVSVHGHRDHGCGDVSVNVWGLFRKTDTGGLIPVQLRALDQISSIDRLIDVDGDGEPEILGRPWLGLDLVLAHPNGEEIDRLPLEFYGCPC